MELDRAQEQTPARLVTEKAPERERQGWDGIPDDPRVLRPQTTDEEIAAWESARVELHDLAKKLGLSMGAVVSRSGVPGATLSAWYAGRWKGVYAETTAKVQRWLAAYSEQQAAAFSVLQEPGYIETPTAKRVMQTLVYVQALGGMAIVTLGSGMGKSRIVQEMLRTRPHTFHVVISPASRKVPGMLRALASAVSARAAHPGQLETLIGEKLQRNGRQTLLMVDEAQYLTEDAVNQLRRFSDVNECGVVLLGNEEAYQRWAAGTPKPGYGQIPSRFDDRLRILKPHPTDIAMYLDAWGIHDDAVRQVLTKVGEHPGALRQINKTIKIAGTIAGPKGRPIEVGDVIQAWSRRSGGEVL